MAQAAVDNALLESLIGDDAVMSNPSTSSPNSAAQQIHHMPTLDNDLQQQQQQHQGLAAFRQPPSQKYRVDNTETIVIGGGNFSDMQPDELNPERRVGPIIDIDGGNLKVYCSDTVLRSKKNHALKTVIRKLNIARAYTKKGGKKGIFRIDVPSHMAKDLATSIQSLGQMVNVAGKPDFQDYLQLNGPPICVEGSQQNAAGAAAASSMNGQY